MKKLAILLGLLGLMACSQLTLSPDTGLDSDEIAFKVDDFGFDVNVSTKATAVTESDLTTNGFRASCVTGSAGSDSEVWSNVAFSKSGTYWKGGKYWPTSNPSYRFYAVYPGSYTMTAAAGGATISASNAHDIVCAYASSSTYKTANTLTFNHIFARLGSVTVNAGAGYTISDITIAITPKTGGTYNLRTGEWSSKTSGSATSIGKSTPGTKNNDIYLVPGSYTLFASWTATNEPYSQSFSGKTVELTLVAGKTNNITCTLTGNGTEIEFGVSLSAWSNSVYETGRVSIIDLPQPIGRFQINAAGEHVAFAPGNLQCTVVDGPDNTGYNYIGSDWCFTEHQWDYLGTSDGDNLFTIGKKMDLLGWVGASAEKSTYGLCSYVESNNGYYGTSASDELYIDWGDIPEVVQNIGSGWFTLNTSDFAYIFESRPGGTVGGTVNARYTLATIRMDVSEANGVILFPDDCTIATSEFTTLGTLNDVSDYTTKCTAAQWTALEAKGCVFLPAAGYRQGNTRVGNVGIRGYYWTSSAYDESNAWRVRFANDAVIPQDNWSRRSGLSVRLVKAVN